MDQLTERDAISRQHLRLADICRAPLAITFATSVALMSGATMLYPVLPVIADDLKIDATRIGLVMAAYTAPAIVLAPLFGVLADLRGRKWMLVFGLAVFSLAGAAAALAPDFGWLLAMRVLQGVGMSAITPLTIVLISDLLPDDQEIHGQGLKVAFDRVAMIVLPLAGGALAALSWRVAFAPYGLVLPLALAALVWMPETRSPGAETLREYLRKTMDALREPRLSIAFAVGFLRFFLDYGLFTYLPLLVALHYAGAATTSGWLIAAAAVGSIVTATGIGHIYARHAAERLLAAAFAASALGLGVIAFGAPLWAIALACFVFGLGNGLISPLQKSLLTRRTPANLRGGVIAVDRVIQQVAKSLAPTVMGLLLLTASLDVVFWCLAAFSAVGMLALIAVAMQRRRAAAVVT